MYINKIDELIDNTIDDFYNTVILKDKTFAKILKEPNFVMFQPQINKMLMDYAKSIDKNQIGKIISNQDNLMTIFELIKRYVCYYFFLYIGFFYEKKRDTFINNIIEFGKNQPSYEFKVDNFFNSESNANIISFFNLSKNIVTVITADQKQLELLVKKKEYMDAIKFMNEFGLEFINKNFKLENLGGNKNTQSHNIIKTIIINELYSKAEKKDVFEILNAAEEEKGEYIFIDIVVPKEDFIDFNMIETVLSKRDAERGMAYEIYDLIRENEDIAKLPGLTHDEKILRLINNHILVPIVDDFLLYHKDTEKYEKGTETDTAAKKKEDTKIRYIVSKIDKVTELYSKAVKDNIKLQKEIEKLFYVPLSDRKAVLINDTEEIKIINKLLNQGRRSIENNEFYNDLITIRMYPYINFKDFQADGFSIAMDKTVDMVRYVSFDKSTRERELQLRIGSENQIANVMGFIIPTNKLPLNCVTTDKIKDIRDLKFKKKSGISKSPNGYHNVLKYIQKTLLTNKRWTSSVYWLFNLNTDTTTMDKYEQVSKMTPNEQMKLIVSKMYDDILSLIYNAIIDEINSKKEVSFYDFDRILKMFEMRLMKFPRDSTLFNNLESIVTYEKYQKTKKEYDENEDIFSGLFGDVIKLPVAPKKEQPKIPFILTRDIEQQMKEEEELSEVDKVGAICQHNVTWEKLTAIRKKNPNQFSEKLFEFIYQYVVENREDEFICKGCGTQINIRNYIRDGSYTEDGHYVSFYSPIEVPLEDIPEYEKYKLTIRNMDKQIERLSSISTISFFVGNTTTIKWRRRAIIKDAIDLLIIHNNRLKKNYKDRIENVIKQYGITRDATNLFAFELDNSIFIYSSKDKDYYKAIKQNNVLIYILFLVMMELNDGQILSMSGDKTCNFYWFEKYTHILFENLKIRKNDKGDLVELKEYPVLCYILYYVSCMITKYNMWYYEKDEEDKKKKFNPLIQKIVINTTLDLINSLIEVYGEKKKHFIYDMLVMKFFQKLNTLFNNHELINKLKELEKRKIVVQDGKKKYMVTKIKSVPLAEGYEPGTYQGVHDYRCCVISKRYINKKESVKTDYFNISNVTNCPSGKFHNWQVFGKTLKCSICGATSDTIKLNAKETDQAITNFKYDQLKKVSTKYCISGQLHTYVFEASKDCNICKKCKFLSTDTLNNKELDELEKNIIAMKVDKETKALKTLEQGETITESQQKRTDEFIDKLKNDYGGSKGHKEDYYGYIYKFISNIESVIGKNININNANVYLRYDTYIIDHDHNGFPFETPIVIINKDNIIQFKKNHPFFKKDVIYYTNLRAGRIDVFYDSSTYLLLGYKEANKEYMDAKNPTKHLKVNYSILNRLKMLGYESKYKDITPEVDELKEYFKKKTSDDIIKEIVSKEGRSRIHNLKKSITDLQRFIYKIKYGYEIKEDVSKDNSDNALLEKFAKKLENMKLTDKDKQNKVFKKWKIPFYNLFFQNLENKTVNLSIDSKYLSFEDFSMYDYHGNLILFYFVQELEKLIDFNSERYIKTSITYFIIEAINHLFSLFNKEDELTNFEIQRFNYILNSYSYVHDVEEKGHGIEGEIEGFYGEYVEEGDVVGEEAVEQKEDDIEEAQAIDIEGDLDYEVEYEAGVNYD